jgi:aspartate/methionine/tyrosine aminotransferase
MTRLSETARAMRPGVFAELERHIAARGPSARELIPLHLGDTYLDPPAAARLARVDDKSSLYRYGATSGMPELREAIRARFALTGDLDVLLGAGGTHALYCAARCVLDPGDDVLVCAPYWPLAPGIFHQAGARSVEVPFTSRLYDDPTLDAGALLEAALTPKTRAVYLISPNNPDGKVLSAQHLAEIVRFAETHDLWIFSDEVYADVAFDAPHVAIASLPGAAERTVTLHSFSKSRALAGARVGFALAPKELVVAAMRMGVHTVFNVPVAMQLSAGAALADREWAARAKATYLAARDAAAQALAGAPVRFPLAEGGTYLFLDFTELLAGRPLTVLLTRAIDEGVMLAPGAAFGEAYASWARLCFTSVPEARVVEGIARLRAAMAAIATVG